MARRLSAEGRVQLEARREQLALRLQAEARPAGDVVRFARALARLD